MAIVTHRTLIDIFPHRQNVFPRQLTFQFTSRDIGATQGSTVTDMCGRLVGHFRAGTRYWDSALETGKELLGETVLLVDRDEDRRTPAHWRRWFAQAIEAHPHARAWSGEDPNADGCWDTLPDPIPGDIMPASQLRLYGMTEAAVALGVTRQRVDQLRDVPGFPQPIAVLAMGPVFDADAMDTYASVRDTSPGRRPQRPTPVTMGDEDGEMT